jgi:thiosulfate/3-mercaptopyruvate sulfurtransferase
MADTLISTAELAANLDTPNWVLVDASYELTDKAAGYAMYQQGHLPGAVYAHPYDDLSGPPLTDQGRHPLPSPEKLIEVFSRLGISDNTQVVAYDNRGITAARLWWLLNYMGHSRVAVLDGGMKTWLTEGRPTMAGIETNPTATFRGRPRREMLVVRDEVLTQRLLIDSRDAERYRGQAAGSDAVAGHIPGALNRCHALNKNENTKLRETDALRAEFQQLFGDVPSEEATFYCGSGISACQNLLTVKHLGMKPGKLYVGSWSEWSQFDDLPKEQGEPPQSSS